MDKLRVEGGKRLEGSITISGAKNAALPLMAASLMAETEMVLENLPELADTASMLALLNHLGVVSERQDEVRAFWGLRFGVHDEVLPQYRADLALPQQVQ